MIVRLNEDDFALKRGDTGDLYINFIFKLGVDIGIDSAKFVLIKKKGSDVDTDFIMVKNITDGHLRIDREESIKLPLGTFYYNIKVKIGDDYETVKEGEFIISFTTLEVKSWI